MTLSEPTKITDWDDAYSNSAYIEGAVDYPPRWAADAQAYRDAMSSESRCTLDVPYGSAEREKYDLFLPVGTPKGLAVFVHGGYWMAFDKSTWSHLAKGAVDAGWAVILPSYTLAPQAHLHEMTAQIAQAIEIAAQQVEGPINLAGHSAGGHLVSRMMCQDTPLDPTVQARIANVVSISGLHDLRPLLKTKMNEKLQMSEEEAKGESACLHIPRKFLRFVAWVGADERPEFLRQSRLQCDAWQRITANPQLVIDAGKHHFNVIDGLRDPDSKLTQTFLG